jgi:hypothetical protein
LKQDLGGLEERRDLIARRQPQIVRGLPCNRGGERPVVGVQRYCGHRRAFIDLRDASADFVARADFQRAGVAFRNDAFRG